MIILTEIVFFQITVLIKVERGSSVVGCRTRSLENPGSDPPFATVSKFGHFRSLHDACINEYLAIDSGRNVSE